MMFAEFIVDQEKRERSKPIQIKNDAGKGNSNSATASSHPKAGSSKMLPEARNLREISSIRVTEVKQENRNKIRVENQQIPRAAIIPSDWIGWTWKPTKRPQIPAVVPKRRKI